MIDMDELTEVMALDVIAEAGSTGAAPQKVRDDLGLDQQQFRALIGKLLAASKIRRVGERGPAVRYVLSKSPASAQVNGARSPV